MANGTGWKEEFLNEEGKKENGSKEQEERFFDKISEDIKEVVRHFEKDNKRPMRGNHAKILAGITDARFRVSPNIPADLAVGFLQPGKEYKAIVRFSMASSEFSRNDSDPPDLHGVAIRVMTDRGDHDFLMTNAEQHHARDAREAMVAIMAATRGDFVRDLIAIGGSLKDRILGGLGAAMYLITHLKLETALRIASTLRKQMEREIKSLATDDYWSRAPIALGNPEDSEQSVAIKYKLESVSKDQSGDAQNLGKELKDRLSRDEVKFLFRVQRFVDSEKTPIEDATVAWSLASPFETIAELIIPQHAMINDNFVDGLMFSPWKVDLTTFRPLGSMNRSRKKVYQASASLR